ncbi:MAG: type IV pilin N-terminal domain-containing protein [Methanoregula sp.]|jgi:hypothetical protein
MMPNEHTNESAVSPVVGVMLMLVVTIIIAAVVSAFAGGLSGSQTKTPQASLVATDFTVYGAVNNNGDFKNAMGGDTGIPAPNVPTSTSAANIYVTFEHKGGDSFALSKIDLKLSSLQKPSEITTISNSNTPLENNATVIQSNSFTGIGDKSKISGFSKDWDTYMERFPDHGSIIKPGDKFIVHADYAGLWEDTSSINWLNSNGTYSFYINSGDVLIYEFIDKASGRQIASGQIAVPEFETATP